MKLNVFFVRLAFKPWSVSSSIRFPVHLLTTRNLMIMGVILWAQPRGEDDIGIRARVRVQKSKVERFTFHNYLLCVQGIGSYKAMKAGSNLRLHFRLRSPP